MFYVHQDAFFLPVDVILPNFFNHKSASLARGLNTPSYLFVAPSIIPLLSTWTLMGPLTFLRKHKNAVNPALLMVRWTSKFCLHRAIHPMQRPHFLIIIQLHHCPTACPPLPSVTQHRAISGSVALEAFCWHAPALVLLRLPLSHTEVTPVPLAFTERVRNNTSLPLPLLH